MKYQVVELSIRKYLGPYAGKSSWEHKGYAVGIKINDEVYDYKTLKKYNFIDRNNDGKLNVCFDDLVVGKVYAIGGKGNNFDSNKKYNEEKIEQGINSSNIYSEEYKKMKRKIK